MASTPHCCICDRPLTEPGTVIGQRLYCATHAAAINKAHPGLWRASLVQIGGMAAFSGIVAAIGGAVEPLDRLPLIGVGLFLAIVPSALWLIFFYQQDRHEPEPKTRIAQVFLLALLLTAAIGVPAITSWFQVPRFAALNNASTLIGTSLIVGFVYQAIAYVAVRLTVYATAEFDERMDGIVYGTVAGLGVATLLNLHYIIDNGGVSLAPGVIHVVTTALAQASLGGLMGYFMAQAKFEHKPVVWVPLGVAIAAILNGLFSGIIKEVSSSGLAVEPWRSLIAGLIIALAVFFVLVLLMRRSLGQATTASTAPRTQ